MKKLVVISLVGCLLGANQLFGDLKEFNALANRGGRANSQRLLEIYATLTNPREKASAQSTLRRLGIDFRQAQAAAASTIPVAPAVPAIPAAPYVRPAAARPAEEAKISAETNRADNEAQKWIKILTSETLTRDLIDQATEFHQNNQFILTPAVFEHLNNAINIAENTLPQFLALNTAFDQGTMPTAEMEKALTDFKRNFPTSAQLINILSDRLEKTKEARAAVAQAEAKVSKEETAAVAAFLALNTAEALNKKIEDATGAGTKLSQAQIQEVTKHINNLAGLSAVEKTTLITSLEPLL